MANELQASYAAAKNVYFLVRSTVATIWNGSALENYDTANYATYVIAGTEQGTASAYYTADFPAALINGRYNYVAKERVGGSPAETDRTVNTGEIVWAGVAVGLVPRVNVSGQVGPDWSYVGSQGSTVLLSGTTIGTLLNLASGGVVSLLSGFSYPASGIHVVVPPSTLSGVSTIAGSGVFAVVPPSTLSGVNVIAGSGVFAVVPPATLSGVVANSGLFVTVPLGSMSGIILASGQQINLYSGQQVNLYSGERAALATTFLDLPQAIESGTGGSGLTVRQTFRGMAAATFGESSGFLSGIANATVLYQNAVNNDIQRITARVDSFGNRSGIVTDLT